MAACISQRAEIKRSRLAIAVFDQPIGQSGNGGGCLVHTVDRDFFRDQIDRPLAIQHHAIDIRLMTLVFPAPVAIFTTNRSQVSLNIFAETAPELSNRIRSNLSFAPTMS